MQQRFAPYIVWVAGAFSYLVAIINRSSMAALGSVTQEHFHIESTALGMFVFVQLLVYGAMQVPVGILLSKFGSSRVIAAGMILMALGQVLIALSPNVVWAIVARALLGSGDACLFISVIGMLGRWFKPSALPTMNQLTGLMGQAGQLVSVIPFAFAVTHFGWVSGFLGLGGLSALALIMVCVVLRDAPGDRTLFEILLRRDAAVRPFELTAAKKKGVELLHPVTEAIPVFGAGGSGIWQAMKAILRRPGFRLAYWIHLTPGAGAHAYSLIWGTPFLIRGMGLSREEAGLVLSSYVVATLLVSTFIGPVYSRFFHRRVEILVSVMLLVVIVWSAVLLWPGQAPIWLLVLQAVTIGAGQPASLVSFDVLRTHTHQNHVSLASGMQNTAAFTGAVVAVFAIGFLLDLQGAGDPSVHNTDAFKLAMLPLFVIWVVGLTMILIELPKGRKALKKRAIVLD